MTAPRIGVVHSRFNEEICNALLESARAEIARAGAEAEFVSVAGALEIPLARKDKGGEAVRVALEMARLRQELAAKWR